MSNIAATSGSLSGNDTLTLSPAPKFLSFGFTNSNSTATAVSIIGLRGSGSVNLGSILANSGMQPIRNDSGLTTFKITAPDALQNYAVVINDPTLPKFTSVP